MKAAGQSREVYGDFLVAAYRRPDFRVDANLAGESSLAGVKLAGVVTGKYLFGAAMGGRPVQWTYTRQIAAPFPARSRTDSPRSAGRSSTPPGMSAPDGARRRSKPEKPHSVATAGWR